MMRGFRDYGGRVGTSNRPDVFIRQTRTDYVVAHQIGASAILAVDGWSGGGVNGGMRTEVSRYDALGVRGQTDSQWSVECAVVGTRRHSRVASYVTR